MATYDEKVNKLLKEVEEKRKKELVKFLLKKNVPFVEK